MFNGFARVLCGEHVICTVSKWRLPSLLQNEVCSDVAVSFLGSAMALHLRDTFVKFLCCIQLRNARRRLLLEHIYICVEPDFEKYFMQTVAAQVSADLPPPPFFLSVASFISNGKVLSQVAAVFCWFRSLMLNQTFFLCSDMYSIKKTTIYHNFCVEPAVAYNSHSAANVAI